MPAAGIDSPADMRSARAAEDWCSRSWPRAIRARSRSTRPSAPTLATASRTSRRSTICGTCSCSVASPPALAVTTSSTGAREVLEVEFPDLAMQIAFHVPDEHDKRHGQAIAAASLPAIVESTAHEPVSPLRLRARAARARRPAVSARRLRRRRRIRRSPPDAPRALIFSPHPDDECIIGGLALRLHARSRDARRQRRGHAGQQQGAPGRAAGTS